MRHEWKPQEAGEVFLKSLIDATICMNFSQLMVVLVGDAKRIKESLNSMELYLTPEELKRIDPRALLDDTKTAFTKLKQAVSEGKYDGSKVILCEAGDRKYKEWSGHTLTSITDWNMKPEYPNGMLIVTGTQLPDEAIILHSSADQRRIVYIDIRPEPSIFSSKDEEYSQIRLSADSMMDRLRIHGDVRVREWEARNNSQLAPSD